MTSWQTWVPRLQKSNDASARPKVSRADTAAAQRLLKQLGFLEGKVNDATTALALTDFQRLNGLTVTGVADEATLVALIEPQWRGRDTLANALSNGALEICDAGAVRKGDYVVHVDKSGNATAVGGPTPVALGRDERMALAEELNNFEGSYTPAGRKQTAQAHEMAERMLKSLGIPTVEQTRSAQQLMSQIGIYSGPITGRSTDQTASDLREFQRKHGLQPMGMPDQPTITQLEQSARLDEGEEQWRHIDSIQQALAKGNLEVKGPGQILVGDFVISVDGPGRASAKGSRETFLLDDGQRDALVEALCRLGAQNGASRANLDAAREMAFRLNAGLAKQAFQFAGS
jgi:peptidoglycan hydrolase-like protein with peptidoglycan-binding domain